jgi:glycosyltransferase involved in cell wall biosynthesis
MKICILGKYPPIEGGVSVRNYWMARGLAERGHQVYVVTNAPEIENGFRMQLTAEDDKFYEPRFESGGFVKVIATAPVTMNYRYIPWANPFVSRLAALACQTIREHGCEAIYSYYFEPYAVAAHLVSQWTGVPYIVKHAGSDLGRLMNQPDLRTTYEEVLKAADLVVTEPTMLQRFADLGVDPRRIFTGFLFSVFTEFFHPEAPPMELDGLADYPAIGIYGKVGEIKGSYDLLKALHRLREEGLKFNLLAMTHGWEKREDQFHRAVIEQGLEKDTRFLPFVAPWRVPGFIRRCTAVCFLERNFPIVFHGPTIPLEVLACGTCLVVSLEVAKKQMYRDCLMHDLNALIVRDPRNVEELAQQLRLVVTAPERALRIGREGYKASRRSTTPAAFIDSAEEMFRKLEEQRATGRRRVSAAQVSVLALMRAQIPWTCLLMADSLEAWLRRFLKRSLSNDPAEFGEFLEKAILAGKLSVPYLREILRYEVTACPERGYDYETVLYRASGLEMPNGGGFPLALKPRVLPHIKIESFDYDMDRLIDYLQKGEVPPALPKEKSFVIFQPGARNYQINAASADLMPFLDGAMSIEAIHSDVARRYGLTSREEELLLTNMQRFLRELLENGVIGFQ